MDEVELSTIKTKEQKFKDETRDVGAHNAAYDADESTDASTTPVSYESIEVELDDKPFTYDVFESPPIPLTVAFALQQMLMSLSRSLSTSLLVADILCAREDESFKTRLLSTTMLLSGMCTLLQNTVGVRLPLYQGPAATYVVPLLALQALREWGCPGDQVEGKLLSVNETVPFDDKIEKLMGSLMIAGGLHMLVGLTGIVGFLLRFIGPVSVVPALTVTAIFVYSATVKFCKVQWGVAYLTVAVAYILTFYMRRMKTPIPRWSRARGFHLYWFPFQKIFSVLIACLVGWVVSAIITAAGGFSDDPDSPDYYARTDSRLDVVRETAWFIFPYPGQFGSPQYDTGAFVTFLLGTIGSVIDSVGDYYACSKVIDAAPPPPQAVNRGLAIEGMMSFFAGWTGASHATSTFGGNIGAIGMTRVASLRVFQCLGLLFILFGVVGKIGALFITIPYSVVGGLQMINFGVLIGVMMSNLQFIDMNSTRNMAIIGLSMLIAFMMPHWIKTTEKPIDTGLDKLDDTIKMFLANPLFLAMAVACFLDNTVPGSREERGMVAWQSELGLKEQEEVRDKMTRKQQERADKVAKTVYTLPYIGRFLANKKWLRFIPFLPEYNDVKEIRKD